MQPSGTVDAMAAVKILAVLAVFGGVTAKLALDWANGKRPFRGATDNTDGWTSDWGHGGHHGGWGVGDDGGDGDGGDGGGH